MGSVHKEATSEQQNNEIDSQQTNILFKFKDIILLKKQAENLPTMKADKKSKRKFTNWF